MWTRMVGANLSRRPLNEGARPSTAASVTTSHKQGKKESASLKQARVFAFVNKDATTIGTRTKEEALMVHSHVAKNAGINEQGRSSKTKPPRGTLQGQSFVLELCETNPLREHKSQGWNPAARLESIRFGLEAGKWVGEAEVDIDTNPWNPHLTQQAAVRRWIQIRPAVPPSSSLRTLGQGASDPFDAAAFPIDATRHALFKLSKTLWIGYLFPDRDEPRLQQESLNGWNEKMSRSVSDALAFHSHLTTVLAFVSRYMSHVQFGHKTSTLLNVHSSLALHLLRGRLSSGNLDCKTLLLLWEAYLSAFFQGDLVTMKLHFKGLTSASQLLIRSGTLDPLFKDLMIVARLLLASWTLEEDTVSEFGLEAEARLLDDGPLQTRDDTPSTSAQMETYSPLSNPTISSFAETNPWLSEPLVKHLRASNEVIATVHQLKIWRNSPGERPGPQHLLHDHLLALTAHTTSLHTSIVTDNTTDPLTKAMRTTFCLAVCYARRLILDCTWYTAGVFVPFSHLQTHLETILNIMHGQLGHLAYQECLLWMFFNGACAEETLWKSRILNDDDFSTSRWFSSRFFRMTEMMGHMVTREDVRNQIAEGFEKYLFDEQLRGLLEGLCKKRALLERQVREVEMPPLMM